MITLKDANGLYVVVHQEDIFQAMTENNMHIYGMSLQQIVSLRGLYFALGGPLPITEESIKELVNIWIASYQT